MSSYKTVKYICLYIFSALSLVNCRNISRRDYDSEVDVTNSIGEQFKDDVPSDYEDGDHDQDYKIKLSNFQNDHDCWLSLDSKQHFKAMDEIDDRYKKVRRSYQRQVGEELDKKMLEAMLNVRGIAEREVHKTKGVVQLIPAGLNLGGYTMMRMKDSVLFFHRMKLRNDTRFRVNFLLNDLVDMTLTVRLSLHDLHLVGAYERSPTDRDPSILFYAPSYGEVEFLLKNVNYKMEGRLRLIKDRLIIELLLSELLIEDILMSYLNKALSEPPTRLKVENLEDFLERMKSDLDKWLLDYFNDYLMFSTAVSSPTPGFLQAEKDKMIHLNEFADSAINKIQHRIQKIGANVVKIPNFSIFGAQRMLIRLKDGYLRGLDSMYRRSVATGKKEKNLRKIDLIVGFSNLKVVYKYEAILASETPPLAGLLILSADEFTAHMGLSLVKDPEMVDMNFDFMQQMKPESLTVEGPANRMIANFRHLLEHHLIAIMSNTLIHLIKALRSLPKCEPFLFKYNEQIGKSEDFRDHNINKNKVTPRHDVHGHNQQIPNGNHQMPAEIPHQEGVGDIHQPDTNSEISHHETEYENPPHGEGNNSHNIVPTMLPDTYNSDYPVTDNIAELSIPEPSESKRSLSGKRSGTKRTGNKNMRKQHPKNKNIEKKSSTHKLKMARNKNLTLKTKQKNN